MKHLSFVQWAGWLFVLSGLMESCLAVGMATTTFDGTISSVGSNS
jgi:hypothetical protein